MGKQKVAISPCPFEGMTLCFAGKSKQYEPTREEMVSSRHLSK